jgi:hypothetical protein
MTATSQRNGATHKDTHQEIEQHERELKDLLNRVLKEPLHSAFAEFGSRLDVLEEVIDRLSNELLPGFMQSNEEISRKEFSKQRRFVEDEVNSRLDVLHEQLRPDGQPLGDTVVSKVIDVLGARLERLENKLTHQVEVNHLVFTEVQASWQKKHENQQQQLCGLQERVAAQLAAVGKSLRTMQILTLSMAVISAMGVVAMMVRSFL